MKNRILTGLLFLAACASIIAPEVRDAGAEGLRDVPPAASAGTLQDLPQGAPAELLDRPDASSTSSVPLAGSKRGDSITQAEAAPAATLDNPKPLPGDLVLPMPGDAEMVFRPVPVPGKSFWGGGERIVQLGDAEGGMFEGLQRVKVDGSFPSPGGESWVYFLGKYEVTKRQFVAVMGMDALLEESADPSDQKLPTLTGRARDSALSMPIAAVSWPAVAAFIHRYNLWLFDPAHPDRLKNMPRLEGIPGYFRLPTEVEWEYSARGGYGALQDGSFNDSLPFPRGRINNFSWHRDNAKRKVRPVGLRQPNRLGLHDMFGNVQEYAREIFRPEIWQGKPGGLVARGGSVFTSKKELRSSNRAEVGVYRWNPDKNLMAVQKSFTTGARLSIGSDVVVSPQYWQSLREAYDSYLAKIRAKTPVGMTLDNPMSQGASAVGMAHTSLDELIGKNEKLASELNRVKRYIEQAERKMEEAQQAGARSTAQDALRYAAIAAGYIYSAHQLDTKAKELEGLMSTLGSRYQRNLKLVQDKAQEKWIYAKEQLDAYARRISELGEYGPEYSKQALKILGDKELTRRERSALALLGEHLAEYRMTRRIDREEWQHAFKDKFQDFSE